MKHLIFQSRFLILLLGFLTIGISQVWGADVTLAKWEFASGTAGTNYPSNKTNFAATGGTCKSGSTFYLDGSGSTWNSTKNLYAFTAVTDITITVKAADVIAKGAEITFKVTTYYNKDKNAPMKGFNLTCKEGSGSLATTGLSVTSWSLSTSSAEKTVVYTTQNAIAKDGTITLKLTGTGKVGAGEGYMGSISVTMPEAPSGYTIDFECDDATSGCPSQLTNKTKLPNPLPTAPTKTGYTFIGWYTNSGLTAAAIAGATLTANATLYAKWNAKDYEITLDKNEHGTEDGLFYVTYNEAIDSKLFEGVTASDGWVLNGYFTASSGGEKVVTTEGVLVNNVTGWTTADGKWNKDGDNIKLYAQYEKSCSTPITISKSTATLPSGCSFSLDKTSGCGDDAGESVLVTCSPATHYTVTAVSSTSGTPGAISNNKCTVSGIKESTTISVTFTEDTKYTITFADNLQHTASIPNMTDNKIVVYENEIFTFPTIDDKTAATSGTCEQIHYHFMGWVLSTHEGTIDAEDIKTGTSAAVTAAATYYAVWAKEEL